MAKKIKSEKLSDDPKMAAKQKSYQKIIKNHKNYVIASNRANQLIVLLNAKEPATSFALVDPQIDEDYGIEDENPQEIYFEIEN